VTVGDGASATIENCVLTGNSAGFGGGVYVTYGTATLYGCTFASNTAGFTGPDIHNDDNTGTISVNGCAAGSYGTQGASLSTSGTISGSPYSFSGCTPCPRWVSRITIPPIPRLSKDYFLTLPPSYHTPFPPVVPSMTKSVPRRSTPATNAHSGATVPPYRPPPVPPAAPSPSRYKRAPSHPMSAL